jgi:hypothetical protein
MVFSARIYVLSHFYDQQGQSRSCLSYDDAQKTTVQFPLCLEGNNRPRGAWMDHDNAVENGHVEESLFVAHNEKFDSRRAMNDVDKIG